MCFALHNICVLYPSSNLVFEILLGSMFIKVCHSKARHCRYSFDFFYIYILYIYIVLFEASTYTYTSFHVAFGGANSQSEIPM